MRLLWRFGGKGRRKEETMSVRMQIGGNADDDRGLKYLYSPASSLTSSTSTVYGWYKEQSSILESAVVDVGRSASGW